MVFCGDEDIERATLALNETFAPPSGQPLTVGCKIELGLRLLSAGLGEADPADRTLLLWHVLERMLEGSSPPVQVALWLDGDVPASSSLH